MLSAYSSKSLQGLTDAERELESLISDKEKVESEVLEIFNVDSFGAEGEWKKLDGICLTKDAGECVSYFLFFGPYRISSYLKYLKLYI